MSRLLNKNIIVPACLCFFLAPFQALAERQLPVSYGPFHSENYPLLDPALSKFRHLDERAQKLLTQSIDFVRPSCQRVKKPAKKIEADFRLACQTEAALGEFQRIQKHLIGRAGLRAGPQSFLLSHYDLIRGSALSDNPFDPGRSKQSSAELAAQYLVARAKLVRSLRATQRMLAYWGADRRSPIQLSHFPYLLSGLTDSTLLAGAVRSYESIECHADDIKKGPWEDACRFQKTRHAAFLTLALRALETFVPKLVSKVTRFQSAYASEDDGERLAAGLEVLPLSRGLEVAAPFGGVSRDTGDLVALQADLAKAIQSTIRIPLGSSNPDAIHLVAYVTIALEVQSLIELSVDPQTLAMLHEVPEGELMHDPQVSRALSALRAEIEAIASRLEFLLESDESEGVLL